MMISTETVKALFDQRNNSLGLILHAVFEFVILDCVEHILVERKSYSGFICWHRTASFYEDYNMVRFLCEDEPDKKVMNFLKKGIDSSEPMNYYSGVEVPKI